ncbi:nuclear transport factor 2 family protein [Sphingomonas naphthae]|uniref:Nuclear transport factor 2 family protein n=1 Tax=Sphingomonas naphthae TaxID=1813468 RepID=A0ABY7TNL7_9SPHN|nr:nuclear transport factor 2 family protein [Sphingomonas naphthae]WCT73990.1 nuclear transport factor 2 family protein [Sphingomonas naphthae]
MTDLTATRLAIADLHARYTDAVWRMDFPAFGQCFTRDAVWRIGGLEPSGRDEIVALFERIMGRMRKVLITLNTPIVDISDGIVTARTYVNERVAWADGKTNISIGRYYERFAEEEGRLRFAWRLFQLHYSGPPDLTGTYFDHEDYGGPPGMPGPDAPSGNFAAAKWGISAA